MKILQPPGWTPPRATPTASPRAARRCSSAARSAGTPQQQFETDDFVAQARQALANIVAVLRRGRRAARAHRAHDLVRRRQARVPRELCARSARAYREIIGRHFPAMTAVEVTALIEDRARVEIEATAVVPDGSTPAAKRDGLPPARRGTIIAVRARCFRVTSPHTGACHERPRSPAVRRKPVFKWDDPLLLDAAAHRRGAHGARRRARLRAGQARCRASRRRSATRRPIRRSSARWARSACSARPSRQSTAAPA